MPCIWLQQLNNTLIVPSRPLDRISYDYSCQRQWVLALPFLYIIITCSITIDHVKLYIILTHMILGKRIYWFNMNAECHVSVNCAQWDSSESYNVHDKILDVLMRVITGIILTFLNATTRCDVIFGVSSRQLLSFVLHM